MPLKRGDAMWAEPERSKHPRGFAPGSTMPDRPASDRPPPMVDADRHPILKTLAHRALNQLFDHFGLTMIPAEAWAALEATGDPVRAFEIFAGWVGCDSERLRQGHTGQAERMQAAIDLLMQLSPIRPFLTTEGAEHIRHVLKFADEATLRENGFLIENLVAIQACRSRAAGLLKCPSYEKFAQLVEEGYGDPLAYTPDDIEAAFMISDRFIRAMHSYSATRARMIDVTAMMGAWFTARGSDHHIDARDGILLRADQLHKVYGETDTATINNIEDIVDNIEVLLQDLLEIYEYYASERSSDDRKFDDDEDDAFPDERTAALKFFGFGTDSSPSDGELRKARNALVKRYNTDNPENRKTEAQREKNVQMMVEINRHYSVLKPR